MIEPQQFRLEVIRPTLRRLGLWSLAAERLLLGTAITESGLEYLVQHRGGPARGVYQIEPATHDDVWGNFLIYREELRSEIHALRARAPVGDPLITNLAYATAIARLVYFRKPQALPGEEDVDAMADYWKAHYNTHKGKGRPEQFIRKSRRHILDAIMDDAA